MNKLDGKIAAATDAQLREAGLDARTAAEVRKALVAPGSRTDGRRLNER